MARVDVIMPQMGESIAEGTLAKWFKKVGESVQRDEPIFEISTDKVDAEIPAPAAGTLVEIKVEEGRTVPVQTVVAVIETDQKPAAAPGAGGATREAPAASIAAAGPAGPPGAAAPTAAPAAPAPATPEAPPAPPASRPPPPLPGAIESAEERLRRRSTPLVRRIADEHGVDIAAIQGTGYAGRVTKRDILGYLESRAAAGATALPAAGPAAAPIPAPAAAAVPEQWAAEPWPGDRAEPMSRIRRLTMEHMVFSRRTSAHVTSFYEVDMTRVAALRAAHRADYEAREAKLTYLGFIVKAVADQLRRHPVLNASVAGTTIIYRAPINIGIAVALDWGLIVPVLKHADELSLLGIARQMADLAQRARGKKLLPEEVQQGTFTITNPGVFGSYIGTPIIVQPQVAILGVGAVEKRPKVVTLEDGTDVIVPRTMTMLSISYDHRVVDGADADRFMADLKAELEEFPENAV